MYSQKLCRCNKMTYGSQQKEIDKCKINFISSIQGPPKYGSCN